MSNKEGGLMILRHGCIALTLLALGCPALSASSAPKGCTPLEQPPDTPDMVQDQVLYKPGRYCLQEDLFVKGHKSFPEGGRVFNVSPVVLTIEGSDIAIDLNGHTIWSDGKIDAAILTPSSKKPNAPNGEPVDNPPMRLAIRNGTLRMEYSGRAIRFAGIGGLVSDASPVILVSDLGAPRFSITTTGKELEEATKRANEVDEWTVAETRKTLPPGPSVYPQRGIVIENMKISTRPAALVIQGAGTVIRNSLIEVEAGTAIWLYGPGAVIENNTIIVHGRKPGNNPLLEADAPIRLVHGDGAVIRNNRIVAADNAHKRALSLFYTGPITVESNRFEGMSANDEWAKAFLGAAQVKAADNTFGSVGATNLLELPWWKKLLR